MSALPDCLFALSGWNVRGKNTKEPRHIGCKAQYCGTFFVSLNFIVLSNPGQVPEPTASRYPAPHGIAYCGGLLGHPDFDRSTSPSRVVRLSPPNYNSSPWMFRPPYGPVESLGLQKWCKHLSPMMTVVQCRHWRTPTAGRPVCRPASQPTANSLKCWRK